MVLAHTFFCVPKIASRKLNKLNEVFLGLKGKYNLEAKYQTECIEKNRHRCYTELICTRPVMQGYPAFYYIVRARPG